MLIMRIACVCLFCVVMTAAAVALSQGAGGTEPELVGEVLAIRNSTGKITQVRLRTSDARIFQVELDGTGALLGVRYSGSFVRIRGTVYVKQETGARWIRVNRFWTVPRPADWPAPSLVCYDEDEELEDEPDGGPDPRP